VVEVERIRNQALPLLIYTNPIRDVLLKIPGENHICTSRRLGAGEEEFTYGHHSTVPYGDG
jgi:hypothetical protein